MRQRPAAGRRQAAWLSTPATINLAAWFDGVKGKTRPASGSRKGALGLRQSEALSGTQAASGCGERLCSSLRALGHGRLLKAERDEASYCPAFLQGLLRRKRSRLWPACVREFSHQQGHVAAAAWSAGKLGLLDEPFLAWHLSGGTTELLLVRPRGRTISCEIIGGTTDISAGQLVDRTGKLLGLSFPAGRELDALALGAERKERFTSRSAARSFRCRAWKISLPGLRGAPAT
jgi:N6-L-threonylcarbamoyladenine synthase